MTARRARKLCVIPHAAEARSQVEPPSARATRRPAGASHQSMARRGWTRIDPKPWIGKYAVWVHRDGWRLAHCGHATALTPWALYDPEGQLILTGIEGPARRPDFGTAWRTLEAAASYVERATGAGASGAPPTASVEAAR